MAGVNSVIRIVAAVLTLVVLIFVAFVGVTLYEPISTSIDGPPASLGWNNVAFLRWMGLGLIGLVFTVFIWMIWAPIRRDVRQEQRPRGPF